MESVRFLRTSYARFPILTLNFKTFKESQDYVSQSCILPGDVRCWVHARIESMCYQTNEDRKTERFMGSIV